MSTSRSETRSSNSVRVKWFEFFWSEPKILGLTRTFDSDFIPSSRLMIFLIFKKRQPACSCMCSYQSFIIIFLINLLGSGRCSKMGLGSSWFSSRVTGLVSQWAIYTPRTTRTWNFLPKAPKVQQLLLIPNPRVEHSLGLNLNPP